MKFFADDNGNGKDSISRMRTIDNEADKGPKVLHNLVGKNCNVRYMKNQNEKKNTLQTCKK